MVGGQTIQSGVVRLTLEKNHAMPPPAACSVATGLVRLADGI